MPQNRCDNDFQKNRTTNKINKSQKQLYNSKMNEGPSFSFLSESSRKYPNLTFNSLEPNDSKYQLKDPLLYQLSSNSPPMSDKLQIVLLLQAAQIQRLSLILGIYRQKFQQLASNSKDMEQFRKQTEQLSIGSKGSQLKILKSNESIMSLNGSITDINKYIQKLQNKYKRALKFIEENATNRQELQSAYLEAKEELIRTQKNFQLFKTSSIREYQLLREELENAKKAQLSFELTQIKQEKQKLRELINNTESTFTSEREKYELLLKQERDKINAAKTDIQRLVSQNEDYKKIIERAEMKYRDLSNQKQNALTLAGLQMQRLNSVIKQKANRLIENQKLISQHLQYQTKSQQQINLLKRQIERAKQKNNQSEQQLKRQNNQISRLNQYASTLNIKIAEIGLQHQEKHQQNKLKESWLNSQLRNLSEVFSKKEINLNKEAEQYRTANNRLNRQLTATRQQLSRRDEAYSKKEFQITCRLREIQSEMQRVKNELNSMIQKQKKAKQQLRNAINKHLLQNQNYEQKLAEIITQNKKLSEASQLEQSKIFELSKFHYDQKIEEMEKRLKEYEERMRQQNQIEFTLSNQNNSLKAALEQSQRDKSTIKRNKSLQSLFQEIQTLCSSIRQKEGEIEALKTEIRHLDQSAQKSFKQTLNLRQMLTKLISTVEIAENSRRQDQHSLTDQIRRIFQGQANLYQDLKLSTDEVSMGINKNLTVFDKYQSQLVKSKDSQINSLRQRVASLQAQCAQKSHVQQIVKKVIALTKENGQLNGKLNSKQTELQFLAKTNNNLKGELEKNNEQFNRILSEKEQIAKRLVAQLDEANSALFDQKQNQIKIQSNNLELQAFKKYSEQELAVRDELIKELQNSLKLKNDQNSRTFSAVQEEANRNSKLNDEINELKKTFNFQIYKKVQELEVNKQECQSLRRQLKQLKTNSVSFQERAKTLLANIDSLKQQNIRLKQQNRILEIEQSRYKQIASSRNIFCNQCQQQLLLITELESERKHLKAEIETIRSENMAYLSQREKNKHFIFGYSEKMPILNAQFNRLEQIIEDLKRKNSQLIIDRHEYDIQIDKQEHNKRKISVLNEEITRLQAQNVNLVEQVNAYRLELCHESSQQNQLIQNNSLFVLVFAQVESLRIRLAQKQRQIGQMLKMQRKF